jgi:UDP-2-acetamido-2,6-beta-L-arabino-hexul-4-ose reductase
MKTVLITGAYGFVGRNLFVELDKNNCYKILKYGTQHNIEYLISLIKESDVIVHLAGIHRPENVDEFYSGNKEFTEVLLNLVLKSNKSIPIIYTSSTQVILDNDYGKSKKAAEKALLEFHKTTKNPISIFRLPNIFGKWSKPNYNSVVATWCYNLSRGLELTFSNPDTEITLAYIDDVVESIVYEIENSNIKNQFVEIKKIHKIKLGDLASKLIEFNLNRKTLVMPSLEEDFDRHLYSTYLSYIPENEFSYSLDMKHDNRGWLAEFIKSNAMGQIFISKTKPNITRGNHWHHSKVEKFLVLEGEANIKFRHIEEDETFTYEVSGENLQVIDIPSGYSHSITNTGATELITLFWSNEIFNPAKPDTVFLEV